MNVGEFKASVENGAIPSSLSPALQALWAEAGGDWHGAHNIVQNAQGRDAAWVHAYLHRKEGDSSNAAYWYGRAKRSRSKLSFEDEWEAITTELLQRLT